MKVILQRAKMKCNYTILCTLHVPLSAKKLILNNVSMCIDSFYFIHTLNTVDNKININPKFHKFFSSDFLLCVWDCVYVWGCVWGCV